ncbi:unnamed protein product [Triticum turgidum subsp. durum]|uniref:DUF7733 domain-containing protein n=1 Tax=Triticum turgidum subsp. durum TaxID=4567 RepID=A0A9R0W254_TRITD|nr:unnamed protein product [Triticum turgidum subsp. durum]
MSDSVGPTAGAVSRCHRWGSRPAAAPGAHLAHRAPHHHHYLFSIKQLNTLGAAAVLAFSTTVPLSEIAFGVLLLPYLLLLATPAFPQRPRKPNPSRLSFAASHASSRRAHRGWVPRRRRAPSVVHPRRPHHRVPVAVLAPRQGRRTGHVQCEQDARGREWLRQEMEGATAAMGREGGGGDCGDGKERERSGRRVGWSRSSPAAAVA